MRKRWFFEAQKQMNEQLNKRFTHRQTNFQIVTEDRVIESISTLNENAADDKLRNKDIMTLIVRHDSDDNVSAFIYELNYLQGWHVEPIDFWDKDWNDLSDDQKANYLQYKKIGFLSDVNRDHVEALYYSDSHKNR